MKWTDKASTILLVSMASACDRGRDSRAHPEPQHTDDVGYRLTYPRCGLFYAPMPERDGSSMCVVPSGSARLGLDPSQPAANELPARVVRIEGFFVDYSEVTTERYARFLDDISCAKHAPRYCADFPITRHPQFVIEEGRIVPAPDRASYPVEGASFTSAIRYCKWAGRRLITSDQWEYAARYDPATGAMRLYPWGDTFEPAAGNCGAADCDDKYPASAPVGAMPRDTSPLGLKDMFGNLDELTQGCDRRCAITRGTAYDTQEHPLAQFSNGAAGRGFRCVDDS